MGTGRSRSYDQVVLEPLPIGSVESRLQALTKRERQVLELVAAGLTNAEAADRLGVTVHAVKFHLGSIYDRLGVGNRTEAAVAFHRFGALGGGA